MSATSSVRPGRRSDPALHEQWRQRLARFEQAGLTAAAFCSSEGVSLPSFYSWRRRLRPAAAPDLADGPRLVPVRLLPTAPVELVLPSGALLRLAPGCDLSFVRSLVDALGGKPC
jgi:transposase